MLILLYRLTIGITKNDTAFGRPYGKAFYFYMIAVLANDFETTKEFAMKYDFSEDQYKTLEIRECLTNLKESDIGKPNDDIMVKMTDEPGVFMSTNKEG